MTLRDLVSTRIAGGTRVAGQRGFSLVSAIFLLIVLAGLGAAIVNVSVMQHTASALDLQGTRAYHAARAGIEWGLHRQLRGGACDNTMTFVPPAPTLAGFTVTVTCESAVYANATPAITTFLIQSTACNQPVNGRCPGNGGGMHYVERQLQVRVTQ